MFQVFQDFLLGLIGPVESFLSLVSHQSGQAVSMLADLRAAFGDSGAAASGAAGDPFPEDGDNF